MLALEAVEGGHKETVIDNLRTTFPREVQSKHQTHEQ